MKLSAVATVALLVWSAGANAQDMKAEVIHWWTSGGESAAVKVFADQFTQGRRHLGRHRDRRRRQRAHRRDQPHRRRQSADRDAVQHRQAVRRTGRGRSARERRRGRERRTGTAILPAAIVQAVTRNGTIYAVPVNIHGQNWLFTSTTPRWHEVGCEPSRPTGTELFRRARQAEGRRPDPAGVQRPEELGAQPVQHRPGRTAAGRDMFVALLGQARRGAGRRAPSSASRRDLQAAARLRRSRQRPAATGTTRPAW